MSSFQKLRPKPIPSCNKAFIFKAVADDKRIDGRTPKDFRKLSIGFGLDYGSCIVGLGATRVMCNIKYQISEPKATKNCEGLLNIKFDLSATMVHSYEKVVEIMRIIEKNIKDSKCIDLESLCIIAGEKVYQLEADLIVMNDEGNLPEACSIALLASLSHFKRPDVSVVEDKVKVYSFDERHPIPLNILHYPFCTSFTFFENSKFVCDPLQAEEQICDGYLIVGANIYREITTMHISGRSMINRDIVLNCCHLAIERSKFLTNFIKTAIERDAKKRVEENNDIGYLPLIRENSSILCAYRKEEIELSGLEEIKEEEEHDMNFDLAQNTKMYRYAEDTIGIGDGGKKNWKLIQDFQKNPPSSAANKKIKVKPDDMESKAKQFAKKPSWTKEPQEIIVDSGDSSEEEVQILDPPTYK